MNIRLEKLYSIHFGYVPENFEIAKYIDEKLFFYANGNYYFIHKEYMKVGKKPQYQFNHLLVQLFANAVADDEFKFKHNKIKYTVEQILSLNFSSRALKSVGLELCKLLKIQYFYAKIYNYLYEQGKFYEIRKMFFNAWFKFPKN